MACNIQNPNSKKKGVSASAEAETQALLKQYGTLKRQKSHLVYDVFGENVVISKTWSDHRAMRNNLSVLRKIISKNVPTAFA